MEIRPFPHNTNYLVREDGAVMRKGGRWLKACTLKRGGYLAVSLWENNKGSLWPVHQVVAFTFNGDRPSPRHHAAHHDGNKMNCHRSNIRWKTKEENEADKIRHGKTNRGTRNGMAVLTDEKVISIRASTLSDRELAKLHGVSASCIYYIRSRRHWKHI